MKRRLSRKPGRPKRPPRSRPSARKPGIATTSDDLFVISALDGVQDLARNELEHRFRRHCKILKHPRTDEIHFKFGAPPERLLSLKTAQTLSLRKDFGIARPRTLLSPEHVASIGELIQRAQTIGNAQPRKGFRLDASGSDSPTMQRLAEHLENKLDLRYNQRSGDCVVGLRPGASGWEVLCRVGNRPLATRGWRKVNYKGSLNAPIAACMVELARPRRGDSYLNIMCGSGTLLIERLLRLPTRAAIGVDNTSRAVSACRDNIEAAGLTDQIQIIEGDARKIDLPDGAFDVITTDLPYGEHLGARDTNPVLYRETLKEAERLCRAGGKMVVLSQDIASLAAIMPELAATWKTLDERRIVQRDFRPMCVTLQKK